ncbi:SDR family NAD(P)-dependent oxidoreductase [Fischerella sp. PCC 9605]|uniref:SDR family NAD(P)-dependent oxidoreductase n=1 Tax=Fischerella sp. PCC 9605 TaxID=1173024 RepID=UPI0004BA7E14|nr:SDR family NAD(P)-dependent oxidoreductase [Fischerella sp. PCC 9605]
MSLKGKVAIITGTSRGIGRAIALTLATAGATAIVNYASQVAKAQAVVEEIEQAGGEAIALGGDMSKLAEIEALFAKTKELYGHIDIVVHNAGDDRIAAEAALSQSGLS